ncbi:hypothetical protein CF336_g6098 [Tilletia laevis]|nr:hypothetical protein CF336_g6098 [Tilletia laevis]
MVYHVRSESTTVGRKDIVLIFYLYALLEILAVFFDSAIIPTYSQFAGMAQHSHYGCPRSPSSESASTSRRPASKASQEGHQHPRQASALSSHLPIVCVLIYGLLSVVLVVQTQDDRWLLGDITFGVLFFAARCVLMFAFSDQIYATHHRLPIIPPSSTMSDDDHNRNNHRTYAHDAVQVCYQCLRLRSRPRAAHPSLPSLVASFTPVSAVTSTAYVKAHGILPRRSVNLLTETDLNAIDAMVSSAVDSHYRRTGLPQRLIHSSASIPIHAGFYKSVDEL